MHNKTKLLGGIGYLVCIGILLADKPWPHIDSLALLPAICVLIAFFNAGRQLDAPAVNRNIVCAVIVYFASAFFVGYSLKAGPLATYFGLFTFGSAWFTPVVAGTFKGAFVNWILTVIAALLWYRGSRGLAHASGEKLFGAGGLVLYIGVLVQIIDLGYYLMLVGAILQCIAFFITTDPPADQATRHRP